MPENCDFCLIGNEEDRILNRTGLITSFLSNPRLTLGHVLVVPNRHIILPKQLNDNEILAMHREADRVSGILLGSIALGVDRWQKARPHTPEGPIKRDHVHLHVLPSSPGQPIYDTGIEWGGDGWLPLLPDEMAEMVELLRLSPVK